jgi:hypothetical protein
MAALLDGGLLSGGDGRHHPGSAGRDRLSAPGSHLSYRLTAPGRQQLGDFGVDIDNVMHHRPPIRYCLDWSEQQHHLAGPLGKALTGRLLDLDWIRRGDHPRAVVVTEPGRAGLHASFGLSQEWEADDLRAAASGGR